VLKIVFLVHLNCYKETNHTIYLCSRHVPRFAVLGGQDLLEERFWLFCIDKLIPRVLHLFLTPSVLDIKQTIKRIFI